MPPESKTVKKQGDFYTEQKITVEHMTSFPFFHIRRHSRLDWDPACPPGAVRLSLTGGRRISPQKKDASRFQAAPAAHRRTEFPKETEDGDARGHAGTSVCPTGAVRHSLTGGWKDISTKKDVLPGVFCCGDSRSRTDDPLLAKQML